MVELARCSSERFRLSVDAELQPLSRWNRSGPPRGLVNMQESDDGFTSFMAARWPTLVRSLVTLGCEPHEAEDVAQAALMRCYASWEKVCRADDLDAYVFRTVLNVWNKSRRRRWWGERPVELLPERPTPTDMDLDTRAAIDHALGGLSPEHRAVLTLRFVADLSEQQTATALRVPVGTVKSRTARAIEQIQRSHLREELT
jgi:RNA polymerase sigma-70 factor (sigma-E family)